MWYMLSGLKIAHATSSVFPLESKYFVKTPLHLHYIRSPTNGYFNADRIEFVLIRTQDGRLGRQVAPRLAGLVRAVMAVVWAGESA